MKKQTARRGFTITELVIVIVVIAILAAVLIPTFVSLVNKANMSADEQAVRHMNTVLKAEEATDGKPDGKTEVKNILRENGITKFEPMMESNVFYWDPAENYIVLYNTAEAKAMAPKEYKGQSLNAAWQNLATMESVKMEDLGDTLEEALEAAQPGQAVVLNADTTLSADSLPKDVGIDMNGKTLTISGGLVLEGHTTNEISNGVLKVEGSAYNYPNTIGITEGSKLVLNEVEVEGNFYLPGDTSALEMNGGSITSNTAAISTNFNHSNHTVIELVDVDIVAPTGIMLNVPGEINITGGSITSTEQCVFARVGTYNINGTKLILKTDDAFVGDAYRFDQVDKNGADLLRPDGQKKVHGWGTGTQAPSAPIVVGDFYYDYNYDAKVTLKNVEIEVVGTNAASYPDVFLSQDVVTRAPWGEEDKREVFASGHKAELVCDDTVKWQVNNGYTDSLYDNNAGYYYSSSRGLDIFTVDNVYVNGVEQEPGNSNMSN